MNENERGRAGEYPVTNAVIETVAEAQDVDPGSIAPPLQEAVDPDALERLFAGTATVGKVVFNYDRWEVSVFPDGYVAVEKHGEPGQSATS